jgi:hypothetical protein
MLVQARPREGVERRERLVEEQHLRGGHEGAGDGDALLLPARQLPRPAAGVVGQPDLGERALDAHPPLGGAQLAEAETDVVGDGEPRQEPRLLEHDADRRVRLADRLAVEPDLAFARAVEAGDQAQKRGLAAAGAADERDDLGLAHGERHAGERLRAVRIGLGEVRELEHV